MKRVGGRGEGLVAGGQCGASDVECKDMADNVTWSLSQEFSPLVTEWSTGSEVLKSPQTRDQ